jgi:hypothetical protein
MITKKDAAELTEFIKQLDPDSQKLDADASSHFLRTWSKSEAP